MAYETYKVLHIFASMLLFASLGGLAIFGLRPSGDEGKRIRKLLAIGHGLALVLLLVAGFGLMARLGLIRGFPLWIWLKLAVWLLLGAALVLLKRRPAWNLAMLFVLPVLGSVAAWLAVNKPN